MTQPRHRLLFISRDRGSIQSILPLIPLFRGDPRFSVSVVSLGVSRSLLDRFKIQSDALDETSFSLDPARCIGTLLDRYKPDLIVSGSSPAKGRPPETPEQHVIIEARRRGIATLAVLDYWGMYRERFATEGSNRADARLLPDRICALDSLCRDDLVSIGVPDDRIVVTHNPWMDEVAGNASLVDELSPPHETSGWLILYVSQPIAETASVRNWSHTQESLLGLLVSALPSADQGHRHRVLVWRHPAEDPAKWEDLSTFRREDVEIVVSDERGAEVLARVDCVASSHSTVTYEALHYGTPCISLRMAGADTTPLVTDEIGLTHPFTSFEEMKLFLDRTTPDILRSDLRERRRELMRQGLFFSDGHATGRVRNEIERMIENPLHTRFA